MLQCEDGTYWSVAAGSLNTTQGIAKLSCHVNVADTMDGGIADQMAIFDNHVLPRYTRGVGSELLPPRWRSNRLKTVEACEGDEQLYGYCHCRSLEFTITRPTSLSAAPHAPYPDLIYPMDTTRLSTIRNVKDEKWWLYPPIFPGPVEEGSPPPVTHDTKYLAGHCVCPSCRLGSGFEIQSWAWVSRANVYEKGALEPIELLHEVDRPKCLKQYVASPGKYREFCGTCGATAFWWHAGRPDVIDISVGLLDQDVDGVRAEEWLKWHTDRLSFIETSGMSREAVQSLKEGMKVYRDMEDVTPAPVKN
ncbi:hypothetical protein D9613_009984 [Agrocybe pediades]|uniref:CENP-V/GFA domain-containing protein n=1 Tax=Agrocybe pediades TaxID=84607 RepID=A0A8H4VQK7_9AGAR|nr:hypothetical protein D9613_009984 [Agrocybe pediades]